MWRADPVEQPPAPLPPAHVVGAHPPGDRQQPHPHRRIAAVARRASRAPAGTSPARDPRPRRSIRAPRRPARRPAASAARARRRRRRRPRGRRRRSGAGGRRTPARRHHGPDASSPANAPRELDGAVRDDLGAMSCDRWRDADLGAPRRRGPGRRPGAPRRPPRPLPGLPRVRRRGRRGPAHASASAPPPDMRRPVAAGPQGGRPRRPRRSLEHRARPARRRRRPDHRLLAAGARARRRAGHRLPRRPPPRRVHGRLRRRPARRRRPAGTGRTMLPVAAVLAGALVITAVVDLVDGRVPLVGEAQHLPEVAQRRARLAARRAVAASRRDRWRRPARRCAPCATTATRATSRRRRARSAQLIVTVVSAVAATKSLTRTRTTISYVPASGMSAMTWYSPTVERVHDRAQRPDAQRRLGELDRRHVDRVERLPRRVPQREGDLVLPGARRARR